MVDPTKVVRTELENPASIAGLLLITGALVAELPEKETALQGASAAVASPINRFRGRTL
jgi:chaperonin GroEL